MNESPLKKYFKGSAINTSKNNSPLRQETGDFTDVTKSKYHAGKDNRLTNIDTKKPPTNTSKYRKTTSRFKPDATFKPTPKPRKAVGKVKPVSRVIKGVTRRIPVVAAGIAAWEGGKYLVDKYKERKKKSKK